MPRVDDALMDEIREFAWFAHLGEPVGQLPFAPEAVPSLDDALESIASAEWENTTLEARNCLTAHLHEVARDQYQLWNDLTREVKDRLVTPLTDEVWMPFVQSRHLPVLLVHDVQWNVLAALMEDAYRDVSRVEPFFLPLLEVYARGHLPCGWRRQWPVGCLLVH